MIRLLISLIALAFLTSCVTDKTGPDFYPEHVSSSRCFAGDHEFSVFVDVPSRFGAVQALTQMARTSSGLESVCTLTLPSARGWTAPGGRVQTSFDIYAAEVYDGNAQLCVSARTSGGHIISCASQSQVRRAIAAPLGSSGAVINLTNWRAYPG
ncbi:hypothetical protein E2K80_11360 [Rhodophyticola sp. CCM32]|uniref:hypothetical protein n=1 Tax=Rhodophyticola sp. CCM32 TaxID=2916397 RepID=UPI00107F5B8E|nr:hypothetical protein [Rhodophyticola sp. CCM32]QBY01249.1 hypothetical protein E2K80_11360 [Rhodophyticola sp. CCM32]